MKARSFKPASFISPGTAQRLQSIPINPWDVMTASAFLGALGVEDKMLVNRWLYRGAAGTPPFEPAGIWQGGPGAPRVIRKDRAIAWAASGGRAIAGRDCWPQAAEVLERLGWPDVEGPDEVADLVSFLVGKGIVQLALALRDPGYLEHLYR